MYYVSNKHVSNKHTYLHNLLPFQHHMTQNPQLLVNSAILVMQYCDIGKFYFIAKIIPKEMGG